MDEIQFGTDGWRDTLDNFTTDRVRKVGQAVADYLDDDGLEGPVAVGYDARASSEEFADELADVLSANGRDVLVPERDCPTPTLAWFIYDRGLAGGMMVTASHNPPEYNGVKFIDQNGAPALPQITDAIEARLREPRSTTGSISGTISNVDIIDSYIQYALDFTEIDLDGLIVAYDAMHGSGRGVTDTLLEKAGATVKRVRCEQDPTFGGTPPEPTDENLGPLIDAVNGEAVIGIANDGDADRMAVVTPDRGYIGGNLLFAALYDYLLESASGGASRTVSTTYLIDQIAADHNEKVYETAVGFKWIAEAMENHDVLVGGEESDGLTIRGHIRDRDGVLMPLYAVAAESESPIDNRIQELFVKYGEIHSNKASVKCPNNKKEHVMSNLDISIQNNIKNNKVKNIKSVDGLKILFEDESWLLIRPSGTEPKMRIYAEAKNKSRVQKLLRDGRDLIEPLI